MKIKSLILITASIIFTTACDMNMFSRYSSECYTRVCEYEDPIMLKHPHTEKVAVCNPTSHVLLEDCARAYEKQGFIRLREYPMSVPGTVKIDDRYYSAGH